MPAATLLVTAQVLYVASTTTFGCSSVAELDRLQQLRSHRAAFQTALYEQIFTGQCVEIAKGKIVEAALSNPAAPLLLVDRQIQPPGFLAPSRDFRRYAAAGKSASAPLRGNSR
jgi:heme A synthase